jgi:hypothetical protein
MPDILLKVIEYEAVAEVASVMSKEERVLKL